MTPSQPPSQPRLGLASFAATAVALLVLAGPSVGVRDAGELSAAAFSVDVPHPTGFAADMVLLRAAMLVPAGDAAFRGNIATALLMALAASLSTRLTYALAGSLAPRARAALALLPPVLLVTSRTVLRAGTAVEVYALSLSASLAALALVTAPPSWTEAARTRVAALLLGATLAMHTGVRPAALVAMVALVAGGPAPRLAPRRWLSWAGCVFAGALAVVYLPAAARRGGPIDWGDPRDLPRLVSHLTAARIRAAFAHRILVPWRVPDDLERVGRVLGEDLGPFALALATGGALLAARDPRARWIALVTVADVAYAALINPMGVTDRQTLFVAEAGMAVLAAFATARLATWALARARIATAPVRAGGLAVALAAGLAALALVRADGAYAARADGWSATEILGGAGALGEVPPRAVVLCESDDLCGGALYAQLVEGERPDVLVLPRQHLADPSTWRRVRPALLAAPLPAVEQGHDLRVARLRALVATFAPRVRWEQGEILDERLARVSLGTGETPVLAVTAGPVRDDDARAWSWLAPRTPRGIGARRLAATVLFSAGRRVASRDLALAVPLWERAIAIDPEHAAAYTNLGVVRARAGDLPGAIRLTERALSLDPDRLTAWRNLAEYRAALGDTAGASHAMREYARRGDR